MQAITTEIVVQMAHSHQQLARIMDAKRHITIRMAELVKSLPDVNPQFNGLEGLLDNASQVTKSVVAYLNSLAELEEAVAENLTSVLQAAKSGADEE